MVRYTVTTDRNWAHQHFLARPLSQRWIGKLQPLLALNSSRLLLAAGNTIYSYGFASSLTPDTSPPVYLECAYTTSAFHPNRDITALATVLDNGLNRTIFVGYADGNLERITLPPCKEVAKTAGNIDASLRERYNMHNGSLIEGLSTSGGHLLSLSSNGTAALLPLASGEYIPQLIDVGVRSWSCHLCTDASTPYAIFGATSLNPLSLHPIAESLIYSQASVYLASSTKSDRPTAVYAISSAPPACAWGASNQIVVSGWYDGIVRVFDLRSPTRTGTGSKPSLLPSMTFCDPWSPEPIYSLSCGGGSASHITAGSARHSVLAFWDVRSPVRGWSVHAPGNDSSPVYSVIMDGARVFGATESRGFVYDFGPGVTEETYPPVSLEPSPTPRSAGRWRRTTTNDTLVAQQVKARGPGFYVTKYKHNKY
jgi:WD40 repeat protein